MICEPGGSAWRLVVPRTRRSGGGGGGGGVFPLVPDHERENSRRQSRILAYLAGGGRH